MTAPSPLQRLVEAVEAWARAWDEWENPSVPWCTEHERSVILAAKEAQAALGAVSTDGTTCAGTEVLMGFVPGTWRVEHAALGAGESNPITLHSYQLLQDEANDLRARETQRD